MLKLFELSSIFARRRIKTSSFLFQDTIKNGICDLNSAKLQGIKNKNIDFSYKKLAQRKYMYTFATL
jgi:hypothetical protein